MNFDIAALPVEFIGGLEELKKDYDFSLNGKTSLTVKFGNTPGVTRTGESFTITYFEKCDFFRGFVRLLNSECGEEKRMFANMAIMVDCSRNAVLNMSAVKMLIRKSAVMGYNALMLYTEDTCEIPTEPFFGYMRGRYLQDEIKEMDRYAALFGVQLVPCIQTLAHLNGIVRWDRFEPIIDCNDILLAGDERTYDLIDKIFASLSECFSSRKVHIGMDEAHMVGLGKYLERNGYENRFDIIHKHLLRVLDIAEKYGFQCTMWSDMFFRLANNGMYEPSNAEIPEFVKNLIPENITIQYWDYYRNSEEEYDSMLSAHQKLSGKVSFACGAWRWNSFTPSNALSINRNRLALSACKKCGVSDITVTLWGDDGGECSTFAALPALVATAEFAYGNTDYRIAFNRIAGCDICDFGALEIGGDLLNVNKKSFGENFTKVFLYNDLLCGIYDCYAAPEYKESYLAAAERCAAAKCKNNTYAYLFRAAEILYRLIAEKYDFGVKVRAAYKSDDKKRLAMLSDKIDDFIVMLDEFYQAFQEQWYKENKSFGFEVQDIRLGGLRCRMLHCQKILREFIADKTKEISELNVEILPDSKCVKKNELRTNDGWQRIVTVNPL